MNPGRHIAVFGRSGSGKTTRAKEILAERERAVIFDPMDEYGPEHSWQRFTSLNKLRDTLLKDRGAMRRYVYVPEPGAAALALSNLSRLMIAIQQPFKSAGGARMTLLVEEINMAFPAERLPRGQSGFLNLCLRGRHHGIDLIGVSQRPATVGADFRGNAALTYWFHLSDHVDLQTALRQIGSEYRNDLRSLNDHEYLKFERGSVEKGRNSLP